MRKILIAIVAVVLIVVITGGYLAYTYLSAPSQNNNTDTSVPDEIRDRAMLYLMANHTVTIPLMTDLSWSSAQHTALPGSETYLYTSGDWSLSVQYPVVPNPIYTVTANYSAPGVLLSWVAEYQNGVFTEISNDFTDSNGLNYLTPEQIRDVTMAYIKTQHSQTAPYMSSLSWTGGSVDLGGLVGISKYNYQSGGWNFTTLAENVPSDVYHSCAYYENPDFDMDKKGWRARNFTMQNPVVFNPIYTITVQYTSASSTAVTWHGTLQNAVITETSYSFTP